jgi:hypothetical protein
MRQLIDFVLNPVVYGLGSLTHLSQLCLSQANEISGDRAASLGIALGLAAANQHGKTGPPEDECK